ncbi:MAG: hypothetical protein ACYTKD_07310 [Planctomycetota bacterium]
MRVKLIRESIPEPVGEELEYRFAVEPTPSGTWLRCFYASGLWAALPTAPSVFRFHEDAVAFRCREADAREVFSELQQHIARTNEIHTEWETTLRAESGEIQE